MGFIKISPTHTANLQKNGDNPAEVTTNYPDAVSCNNGSSYSGAYDGVLCLKIDVSQLKYRTITKAELKVKFFDADSAIGNTLYAYKISRADWVYNQATYTIYKTGSNWTTAGGDYVTSSPAGGSFTVPSSPNGTWATFDILAIIQDAISTKEGVVDVLITMLPKSLSGANDCQVRGIGYATVEDRPVLELTYNDSNFFQFM